jgi:ABC-type polysaccharide/polyol phosphate export permease
MPTNVTDLHVQEAQSPSRFSAAINNPALIAAVLFCVIGLVIAAVLAVRFPDLGAIIAQSNQF